MPNRVGEWFRKNLFRKYPLSVTIWKKRGNSYNKTEDKARFVQEREGKRYYYLYDHGKTIPVDYKFISASNHINFWMPNRDSFIPFSLDFSEMGGNPEGPSFNTIDEDLKFFMSQEFREADLKYRTEKGFMEKYGNIVIPFVILLGAGIFFWILNKGMSQNIKALTSAVESFKEAAKSAGAGGW